MSPTHTHSRPATPSAGKRGPGWEPASQKGGGEKQKIFGCRALVGCFSSGERQAVMLRAVITKEHIRA